MSRARKNGIASPAAWRAATEADRVARAERLRLPSGATILAVKPEPLEWVLSGRIPQRLLGAALEAGTTGSAGADRLMTREEILELAQFARQLVAASVVKPPIGDGPGEVELDQIPVKDRAFIFEWACRALNADGRGNRESGVGNRDKEDPTPNCLLPTPDSRERREGLSSQKLERFREG